MEKPRLHRLRRWTATRFPGFTSLRGGVIPSFSFHDQPKLVGESPAPDDTFQDKSLYFNREISWLAFQPPGARGGPRPGVAAARKVQVPLDLPLEPRRVLHDPRPGLHEQLEAAVTERSADGLSAHEQLRAIGERRGMTSRRRRPC